LFLVEDSKDEKNLLAGLNLHCVDAMALNDDEKGLSIEFFGFIFSTICLESGNAEFVFSEEINRRFRKLFSTTLYLFLGGWWQIFVLLDARSQLLEVIFLLVQTEAQYNSDTINNISTVGVVKWGSSIFVLWCRKPWRASVTSEFSAARVPSDVEDVLPGINFSDESGFLEKLKMWTIEEKKDTELFLHVWFSKSNFDAYRRCWRNVECFWSHRSRKEGLDNAGWSGRSYIVLLVVFVLNVDDGQANGLSMLATMFSRLDVPNCDLVFMRLRFFISSTGWYRRHFSFSLHLLKPERSSTILLSLSFSRESSMSECVKKM